MQICNISIHAASVSVQVWTSQTLLSKQAVACCVLTHLQVRSSAQSSWQVHQSLHMLMAWWWHHEAFPKWTRRHRQSRTLSLFLLSVCPRKKVPSFCAGNDILQGSGEQVPASTLLIAHAVRSNPSSSWMFLAGFRLSFSSQNAWKVAHHMEDSPKRLEAHRQVAPWTKFQDVSS